MRFLRNIKWSPLEYAEASILTLEAGEEMLSRLEWMTLKPRVVVDMGCGTGVMSSRLQNHYPEASVIALDMAESMISVAKQTTSACVCADAGQLPFRNQSVDLIFANFLLPWHADIQMLLREWRRILRPDGLLILTAFGPDTLKEWCGIVSEESLPVCIDMHDIGDLLLEQGFADPVLDVNHYIMTYKNKEKLFKELIDSGMLALSLSELNSKDRMDSQEGIWSMTYEIVFAHAFIPEIIEQTVSDGVVKIPLAQLKQKLSTKSG